MKGHHAQSDTKARMIKTLLQILPLPVNVGQMLWRSSDVFPMEMAEVKLLWLHVPACTPATKNLHPSVIYGGTVV